jgi:hypothetical protein
MHGPGLTGTPRRLNSYRSRFRFHRLRVNRLVGDRIIVPERPQGTHHLRIPPRRRRNRRRSPRDNRPNPSTGACGRESGSTGSTSGHYYRDRPSYGWPAAGRRGRRRHKVRASQRGSTRDSRRRRRQRHRPFSRACNARHRRRHRDRPGRRKRGSRRLRWGRRHYHRLACCRLDFGNGARKRMKVRADLVQLL